MWPFRPGCKRDKSSRTFDKNSSRTSKKSSLGPRGEKLTAKYLKRAGLKILATNYRCPAGEMDIIALDGGEKTQTIVFVEVKTRSSERYVAAESAVNAEKRRRLQRIARYYLAGADAPYGRADQMTVRFDVVSVVIRDGEKPIIRHIPNAF